VWGVAAVVIVVVVGVAMSVATSWLGDRPAPVKTRHVVVGLVLTLVVSVVLSVLLVARDDPHPARGNGPSSASGSPRPSASPAEVPADLWSRVVLYSDQSAGHPIEYSATLDGRNRKLFWDQGGSVRPVIVPGTHTMVVAVPNGPDGRERLELYTLTGDLVRVLTRPGPHFQDSSPTVAARSGTLYFVRQDDRAPDLVTGSTVMRLTLPDGDPTPVPLRQQLATVSVSDDGRTLAGSCTDTRGCLVDVAAGTGTFFSGTGYGVYNVAISPDGRWVAYDAPLTNPYGEIQVYAYDIRNRSTVQVSRLIGKNMEPAWPRGVDRPCLVFLHARVSSESLDLACLTSTPPVVVEAIPGSGELPVWLDD
jgi:hypothetical protein